MQHLSQFFDTSGALARRFGLTTAAAARGGRLRAAASLVEEAVRPFRRAPRERCICSTWAAGSTNAGDGSGGIGE